MHALDICGKFVCWVDSFVIDWLIIVVFSYYIGPCLWSRCLHTKVAIANNLLVGMFNSLLNRDLMAAWMLISKIMPMSNLDRQDLFFVLQILFCCSQGPSSATSLS